MTEEVTLYLSNMGAILELCEAYIKQMSHSQMSLEVITRIPNSSSTPQLREAKSEAEQLLKLSTTYLNSAKKAIQEIYNLDYDELRNHLVEVKTGVIKSLELAQQERALTRTYELLRESNILPQEENEMSRGDPSDPTTWSRREFEEALEALRNQLKFNDSWIKNKIQTPRSKILMLPREG